MSEYPSSNTVRKSFHEHNSSMLNRSGSFSYKFVHPSKGGDVVTVEFDGEFTWMKFALVKKHLNKEWDRG